MQAKPLTLRQLLVSNLLWFAGSLALAFVVWTTAVAQRDPIEERRLNERAPIQFNVSETMLITDVSTDSVALRARGQRSALGLLTVDDVTVSADLINLEPGTYPITLGTEVRRERVSVDTIPRQVTVTLELLESRLVPVRAILVGELPPIYEYDEPQFDALEVTVSGASSLVNQVDAAAVRLDLSDQRSTLTTTARLVPINLDGEPVENVTLQPSLVNVTLPIQQRPDVREVSVQPNLVGADELPPGYLFTSLSYEPRSVLVSGPANLLESLPATFFTAPIDLSGRTSSFEVTVPVELPSSELVIISSQEVQVSIDITPQTASQQFDRIPVEIIGLSEGLRAELTPAQVTLLVTGPQPALEDLQTRDLRVILDLDDLDVGGYQLTPQPALAQGLPSGVTISVLPASIDVQITEDDSP